MNASARRQQLIRLIHVAKRDLGLDDDTYRAILQRIGKAQSAADLNVSDLERVLEHLKRSGFKVRPKGRPSRPLAADKESTKIRALWLFLHQLGEVKNPSEDALGAYVKRITGVDALQWVDGRQAERLIETLKKWAMRVLPGVVRKLAEQVRDLPLTDEHRARLDAALGKAFTRETFDPMFSAWESLQDALTSKETS